MIKNGIFKICPIDNNIFYVSQYRLKRGGTYCSKKCNLISLMGNKRWVHPNVINSQFKKGHHNTPKKAIYKNCLTCQKKFSFCSSENRKYCSVDCYYPNRNKLINCKTCKKAIHIRQNNSFCSSPCYWQFLKGKPPKFDIAKHRKGKPAWNKGKILTFNLPEAKRIRNSEEYWEWRKNILKRDKYICQICGFKGGKLIVDHIKPFALYPDLRLDHSNGRTLCVPCHRKTPTFGGRMFKFQSL